MDGNSIQQRPNISRQQALEILAAAVRNHESSDNSDVFHRLGIIPMPIAWARELLEYVNSLGEEVSVDPISY